MLIHGAKVAGIVIESPGGVAPAKDRVVIGVGINVNSSWADAPREAGSNGAALCDVAARDRDAQALLIGFLNALEQRLNQLGGSDPQLSRAWQQRSWLNGKDIEVDINGYSVVGIGVVEQLLCFHA